MTNTNLERCPTMIEKESGLSQLFTRCTSKQIFKSQLEIIESINRNDNTAIMKPRQIFGIDTAIICYLIRQSIGSSWNSVIYCNSQDAVWAMAPTIEQMLAQMLKVSNVPYLTRYSPHLQQPGFTIGPGSILISRGVPFKGKNIDCCYFSEAAFIPNLNELVNSIRPSLKPIGKIVLASTKNPRQQNLFSDVFLPEHERAFWNWNKIILDWRNSEVADGDLSWDEKMMIKTGLSRSDWDQEYETKQSS